MNLSRDNLAALEFILDPAHMQRLDEVSRIELGFPHDFLATSQIKFVVDGGANIEGGFQVGTRKES